MATSPNHQDYPDLISYTISKIYWQKKKFWFYSELMWWDVFGNTNLMLIWYVKVWRSCDSGEFVLELFKARSERAVQELRTSKDLESSENSGIDFVGDSESDSRLVFLESLNYTAFFFLVEFGSRDDSDVFFFVEDFAVGQISVNGLIEFCQSWWKKRYLPESIIVSMKLRVIWL